MPETVGNFVIFSKTPKTRKLVKNTENHGFHGFSQFYQKVHFFPVPMGTGVEKWQFSLER